MRVLVTNDDGIDSPGLHALARVAMSAGHDVVVAAPVDEFSGAGAGLSAVDADGRIIVEPRTLDAGVPAYAVAASPAFIVLLATQAAFGPAPELVLSGINRGANTGLAVLHSGTVGAAFTAVNNGCRAMAVSVNCGYGGDATPRWETAAAIATDLLPLVCGDDTGFVLNVNAPNSDLGDVRGIRRARLATFGVVQLNVLEQGQGYVRMSLEQSGAELEPGSDEAWLVDGYATATPIRPTTEATDIPLAGLVDPIGVHTGG
jgi:5'/3'-nucleotidase